MVITAQLMGSQKKDVSGYYEHVDMKRIFKSLRAELSVVLLKSWA